MLDFLSPGGMVWFGHRVVLTLGTFEHASICLDEFIKFYSLIPFHNLVFENKKNEE